MLCFASDKVPREAKLTDNIDYISLEKSYEYWAKYILNRYNNFTRQDVQKSIN